MKFNLRTKTVLVIVGPHNCGKSTFAENFRVDTHKLGLKTAVLSTDSFRRILLDEPGAHAWDHRMMEVSGMAFQMLEHAYTAALHYTVANDFIIIDSKGYDASFRDRIRKQGQDAGWDVVMVIMQPEKDEYLDPAQAAKQISLRQRVVTQEAIDTWVNTKNKALGFFRQKIVGDLNHKGWDGIFRLRRYEDVNTMEIEVKNLEALKKTRINHWDYDTVIVIPDFHENLDAMDVILTNLRTKMHEEGRNNTHFVFMGDYLDKGGRTRETIDFMYEMVMSGVATVIDGNHENYAHKRITGQIKEPDLALEEKWFTSVQVLLNDEALASKFLDIRARTVPFVHMPGAVTHKSIYITHAPCENKYLGGWSVEALRKQRNFIFHRDSEIQDQLDFIYREARGGDPIHMFGHVSHDGWADCRNKFFMDKGIEENNVACIGLIRNGELELFEIPLHNAGKTDLPKAMNKPIKREKPFNLADYNLDMDDHRFIRSAKRNKLRFISGTMAPAPSTDTEIESLRAGLNAFVKQGITKVMLQPKYMGSRAQLYIYPELEKCHFVSRNGYRVRDREEFAPIFAEFHTKFNHVFDEPYDDPEAVQPLIIDGELLPWHVLGEDLINREFGDYQNGIAFELNTLASDKAFAELEFKNKLDVETKLKNLKTFSDNLNHYGAPGPVEFRGFDVLTYRDKLGITDHASAFETVNDDRFLILYRLDEHFDSAYETAKKFFDELTIERKMEGVVIKPMVEEPGKLPYMKVRNEEYLTLIYGYDYQDRYERLSAQKNVTGKARLAIKERDLGLRMLTEEIGSDKWMESVVKLIFALKEEKTLDPRL